jgi:hypothetical protein
VKILIHSHTFWPNIGGIENVGHYLAEGLTEAGHTVTVVTETESDNERAVGYKIARNPSALDLIKLIRSHDLVHANGSTMRCFPATFISGKPFTWSHFGYQLQCIDGLGWLAGKPAPLNPWSSIFHHLKLKGLSHTLINAMKLWLRRLVACLVKANIASSHHLAERQPLPRQKVIYNPVKFDR